ncbi:MAG: serpin family protein [Candidatus Bipolaricaulia bacterium]
MIRRAGRWIRISVVLGLVLGLFVGAGCEDDSPATIPQETTPVAGEPSGETADSGEGTAFSLAASNAAFAFDLYHALQSETGNLFLSPYSISAALAMTLAGAREATASQMAEVLHYDVDQEKVHEAFRDLAATLSQRGAVAEPYEGEGFSFHVVNAMWPQTGYPFLESFVGTLTTNYGAGLRELDFETDPESARLTINDWVSDQTEERIQDLLPEGTVDESTRLVLTNAIYFKAPWREAFDPENTVTEPFTLLDGETVDVPMMHRTESYPYATWDGGVAFEIPYNGEELSMVVLVPDEGAFEIFDASLTAAAFDGIVEAFEWERISLGLPRFEYTYEASLVPPLRTLGMTDAFDGERADFSGITGERDLVISDVVHKAFVSVNEEGTEAAAATAVVFRATGMPAEPLTLTVDRPFLFVIRDRPTGSILFIGRVLEP